jgi:hypothetical protein
MWILIGIYAAIILLFIYRYKMFKPALRSYHHYRRERRHKNKNHNEWVLSRRYSSRSEGLPFFERFQKIISVPFVLCLVYISYPFVSSENFDDDDDKKHHSNHVWSSMNKPKSLQGNDTSDFCMCFQTTSLSIINISGFTPLQSKLIC